MQGVIGLGVHGSLTSQKADSVGSTALAIRRVEIVQHLAQLLKRPIARLDERDAFGRGVLSAAQIATAAPRLAQRHEELAGNLSAGVVAAAMLHAAKGLPVMGRGEALSTLWANQLTEGTRRLCGRA